jgi:hypothetical protein
MHAGRSTTVTLHQTNVLKIVRKTRTPVSQLLQTQASSDVT